MTDYNDGEWYLFSDCDVDVHSKSIVEVVTDNGRISKAPMKYANLEWYALESMGIKSEGKPIAFRVTKPYVEPKKPREFWVDPERCIAVSYYHADFIHVREVLE